MSPSLADCLDCKCTSKQAQAYIDRLAKKASKAGSLNLQDIYMKQMMELADCIDRQGGSSVGSMKQSKNSNRMFMLILAIVLAILAWPVLAYAIGFLQHRGQSKKRDKETGPKPHWASGAIGALLLAVVLFIISRLIL